MIKNGDTLKKLIEDVACLKTDVCWIKRLVYVAVGSSVTAAFGVLGQIVLRLR